MDGAGPAARGTLLQVRGLRITAARGRMARTLVGDVSFDVARGEALAIVGESGSGKTMTARSLVNLLPPGVHAVGYATFDGINLLGGERTVRVLRGSRISLLMQDPFTALNPLQTAGAHIAESLPRSGINASDDEVLRRLSEVGISDPDVARRYPFQLSGGMRQRVAIACALAKDPDLLIADEPTTSLDAPIQRDILRLLRSLQEARRMTLIFITHNLRLAFGVGDRIAVMYAGRILEEADPGAVLHAPRHPYTLGLLLAEPPITHARAELRGIPGRVPSPDEVADRCAFMDRCEWAQPVCGRGRPELKLVSASRRSACVRVAEIANVLEDRRSAADAVRTVGPRGTEAPPVLRITALRKTYTSVPLIGQRRSVVAVDDIDLDIGARESVGLIGESGSGKTTIARCVLGLNQPTSGSIQLADVEVSDYRRLTRDQIRHVRHAVQCVFQDPYASLNPAYTVEETLREAIAVGGQRPLADPSALLDLVGLSALFRRRRPATLSGGERQRVAIARAIAVGPRLLLCDEPVAALDVSVQAQILGLLRRLQLDLGMSMLIISHDLAAVRQVTDRLVVMYRGRIVEVGATDDVIDRPRDPYTVRLVQASTSRSETER